MEPLSPYIVSLANRTASSSSSNGIELPSELVQRETYDVGFRACVSDRVIAVGDNAIDAGQRDDEKPSVVFQNEPCEMLRRADRDLRSSLI